eukprot:7398715-Heterocapsa_arctica.AAC.1
MTSHQSSLSAKCVSQPSCLVCQIRQLVRFKVGSSVRDPHFGGAKLPGTPVNAPNARKCHPINYS